MPFRKVSITAIMLFFIGTLIWTVTYGPSKRSFVIPGETVSVRSASEIDSLWHSSGVHGRIAVLFARHLNQPLAGLSFPEMDYLETAMQHGIVRTAYYIVPDRMWSEAVAENLEIPSLIVTPNIVDSGYILLHEDGRIYVVPFSKYIPELDKEKALVVIEPAIWTQQEQARVDGFIRSGQLTSDLTIIVSDVKKP